MFKCVECGTLFTEEYEKQHKFCNECFEGALEEWEERKRERNVERNEY